MLLLRIRLRYFNWFFISALYFPYSLYSYFLLLFYFSRWHFVFCGSPFCCCRSHMSRGRLSPVAAAQSAVIWVKVQCACMCMCMCSGLHYLNFDQQPVSLRLKSFVLITFILLNRVRSYWNFILNNEITYCCCWPSERCWICVVTICA